MLKKLYTNSHLILLAILAAGVWYTPVDEPKTVEEVFLGKEND